ncbi:MAG TPA: helix-turn-helix domain-containing protein [Streptosporangiaceae bacterium]|jgi:transcriptional regulator with XRE-family HTH domain
MPGRAADLIEIPALFWDKDQTLDALRRRDVGRLFLLLRQYAGISQTRLAIACAMTQPKVSGIMHGAQVTALEVFERIADGLNMPNPARQALGLAPLPEASVPRELDRVIPPGDTRLDLAAGSLSGLLGSDLADEEDGDGVRRRTFVGLTGASLFGALLADPARPGPADAIESLTAILATYSPAPDTDIRRLPDLTILAAAVARTKQGYQACRYSEVMSELPSLLTHLQTACAVLDGDARLQARALSAEAYQVAGSVLLKIGDPGLAWLAADRSMQAAHASQDPISIGSSARIITHAMMNGGHHQAAAQTASTFAANLDRDIPQHDPESLSVYGSLLLRGAIAAALRDDRHTAHELLTEAEDAGQRLGDDLNLRWTAFGPTNAQLHRINIAVTLGDAGTALDLARRVDLERITVTERKATLLIDTARAFLQCGKHDKAYLALRAAEQMAHEEIAGRPTTRRLISDLIATAPPSIQRHAEAFGHQLGVQR